jgi:autotransporter-associated beta strand protein
VLLAVTSTATLAGTLNLTGTVGTLPETLMTYGSETGTFNTVTGVPSNDALVYNSSALVLVSVTTGPANLTYLNANGTFDTGVSSSFNGSSGPSVFHTGDNVTFDDTFTGPYTVPISGSVSPGSTTFNNSAGNYVVSGADASSGISGTGSLTKYGTGSVTISTNNNYSGGTFVNGGSLILASANAFPAHGSLAIASGASVTINTSSGSVFNPVVGSLSNSGAIDIKNNAMIIQGGNGSSGSITAVTAQVRAAYNGGAWNGSSGSGVITSSTAASDTTHLTAVGVATGFTTFEGQTVNSSDVLVKYTYYGDANLDGHVDGTDYSRIDNAVAMGGLTGWANGDFNYDGVINGSDYTLIDNAYNMQGAALASELASPGAVATAQIAGGVSAVPEPTSLALIGLTGLGLLGRRRRV